MFTVEAKIAAQYTLQIVERSKTRSVDKKHCFQPGTSWNV